MPVMKLKGLNIRLEMAGKCENVELCNLFGK
jgi:hypothetical protein